MQHYVVDPTDPRATPRREKDIVQWNRWFETANRTVITSIVGHATVLTYFTGVAETEPYDEHPMWCTEVYGINEFQNALGKMLDWKQWRSCFNKTRAEAIKTHELLMENLKSFRERCEADVAADRIAHELENKALKAAPSAADMSTFVRGMAELEGGE